jgi:hypothetical protein
MIERGSAEWNLRRTVEMQTSFGKRVMPGSMRLTILSSPEANYLGRLGCAQPSRLAFLI